MKTPLFVRTFNSDEQAKIEAGLRSSNAFTLRRCQILLASSRRIRPSSIARNLGCATQTVRNAIHAFEQKGLVQEVNKEKDDPDPNALACYGMLSSSSGHMFLRFVAGRPVSSVTIEFLQWLCEQAQAQGRHVLMLIWDNASWHVSKQVKSWLREHNQAVQQETDSEKTRVRIIPCWLPVTSTWLNCIEPKWVHGKRAIVEPARALTAQELKQRICDYFDCKLLEPLAQEVS